VQADAQELRQDIDSIKAAVEAITDRDVNEAIFAGDGNRGLAAEFGERIEPRAAPTSQDQAQNIGHDAPRKSCRRQGSARYGTTTRLKSERLVPRRLVAALGAARGVHAPLRGRPLNNSRRVHRLEITQLRQDFALHYSLKVVERPRHGGAIHNAMVVNQSDVHIAVRVDTAVVQHRGQGRQRMQRRRPQPGVNAYAERAHVVGALATPYIEAEPPQEPAQWPGQAAHIERSAKRWDFFNRRFLIP